MGPHVLHVRIVLIRNRTSVTMEVALKAAITVRLLKPVHQVISCVQMERALTISCCVRFLLFVQLYPFDVLMEAVEV